MSKNNEVQLQDIVRKLEDMHAILGGILKWTRFQNLPRLRELLEKELDDQSKKFVYENTDGQKSMRQVSAETGVPVPTIQGWWNRWYNLGILEPSEAYRGRLKKICSLKDVGMETPRIGQRKQRLEETAESQLSKQPEEQDTGKAGIDDA